MGRASAFYVQKRRASSPSNAPTFAANTVASSALLDIEASIPLIAHSIVAVCSLLVMAMTNSLLAGCTSLLLGVLYQCRPARLSSAAASLSNAEADGASVPRWDRRSLGGSPEREQAELQPEQHAERGEGSASSDESLVPGPARASTAGAPPSARARTALAIRAPEVPREHPGRVKLPSAPCPCITHRARRPLTCHLLCPRQWWSHRSTPPSLPPCEPRSGRGSVARSRQRVSR